MTDDINALLDRVRAVGNRTDLDLLSFLYRHPHALLKVEEIAAAIGHDLARMDTSLHALIEAGLVVRTSNAARTAQILAFRSTDAALTGLLQVASTRTGRLALLEAL